MLIKALVLETEQFFLSSDIFYKYSNLKRIEGFWGFGVLGFWVGGFEWGDIEWCGFAVG